jgi:ATP-dependent exoDNAse (exonuclease V) beta subunit
VRERGRDPHHSFIVQAPAGSGKTELLTQRMLGLLAQVENPEEVVAITFTRKAAAEMSHRLLGRLRAASRAASMEKMQDHELVSRKLALAALQNDKNRGWNLLEQPGRLRIRTIDGLCSELARQLPILSGLGGGQQIAENAEALYHQAAARTMAAIEDDSDPLQADVVRVLNRYDNQYDRLVKLLTSMLGNREQWIEHLFKISTDSGFDRHGLEESLQCLIEAQLLSAREIIPDELLRELPRFLIYALGNAPDDETQVKALLEACGGFDVDFLDLPTAANALPHWLTVTNHLFTKAGAWLANPTAAQGFPAPSNATGEEKSLRKAWKDEYKALLDAFRGNDSLREQFSMIRELPNPGYEEAAWESLESLMRILIRAFQEWKMVMAETGEADYSEIASRAIESLGEDDAPSNLALRLDYRIQHLLVDEFQDTSHSQVRLLDRLTAGWSEADGHTLFLVGDPMQSIYRFRKAEVSLFIKAFEGRLFRHIRLEPLQLTVNFRSTVPVVSWVNRVFPNVMPAHSDSVTGAVSYSKSSTRPNAADCGVITTHVMPGRDDDEEAHRVAEIIRQCDPDEKVAVLVRSRTHASEILTLLDQLKEGRERFRYRAIEFKPLAETTLIRDLVSLTLAMTQVADRLAWLALLRAPFTGLDMADLDALAGGDDNCIILDAIEASINNGKEYPGLALEPSGLQRLQRIAPVLLEAARRQGRESVRTRVESTWVRLGGPACVQNESELDDAATYFDLLESLENQNLPIDRDTLDQRLNKLYAEPDALASDRLQVMTIYAAKGLQFDTVILPGLNKITGSDKPKMLHWFELAENDRIVMSPMRNVEDKERKKHSGDLIRFISSIEKRRQRLENGRLLYVATTRAVHSLHLLGAIKPDSKGEIKPGRATLLGELWPAISAEQIPRIQQLSDQHVADVEGDTGNEKRERALPQLYRRLAPNWQLPEAPVPVTRATTEFADTADYIEFRWAGEDARLTGNLVHRLLQLIAEQGLEAWSSGGGLAGRETWCRRQLFSEGVSGDKADSIIAGVKRAISNCLESDRGKWILDDHQQSECEYALTVMSGGQPRNLVLDRSFVEGGTRWIIDYKTSSHSGGDLEGFLQNETERYREQLQRYRDAVAVNETRPIRTALYFPLLDRFCEV